MCVCVCVHAGRGSNSLTTVLISTVLRGLGISPRKMGVREPGSSLVLERSAFLPGHA